MVAKAGMCNPVTFEIVQIFLFFYFYAVKHGEILYAQLFLKDFFTFPQEYTRLCKAMDFAELYD